MEVGIWDCLLVENDCVFNDFRKVVKYFKWVLEDRFNRNMEDSGLMVLVYRVIWGFISYFEVIRNYCEVI